jgi:hypothetical protein
MFFILTPAYNNVKYIYQKKIEMYLNDDSLRQKIAEKGRDKYVKYFDSTIVAEFIIYKTFNIDKKYFCVNKD